MKETLPTFIGNFRSGTTLVANLLGFHPELAPWFETKAFCEALRWLRVLQQPETRVFEQALIQPKGWPGFTPETVAARMREDLRQTDARLRGEINSGKAAHEFYPLGHDRVAYSLPEAEAAIDRWLVRVEQGLEISTVQMATGELIKDLGTLHAHRSGRAAWVNKTPEIPRFGRELRQCLGDCRVVMMMREHHDVVRSAARLGWGAPEQLAGWCKGMVDESRAAAREYPQHYLELHYESLLKNPVSTLNELLRFIGVAEIGDTLVGQYEAVLPAGGRSLRASQSQ